MEQFSSRVTENNLEQIPKPLFKLILMRHQHPYYKDIGHDLTPEGVQNAIKTGEKFIDDGVISEDDEMYLLHSPKPRAKGTLEFVAEGAKLNHPIKEIKSIRASDFGENSSEFQDRVVEIGGRLGFGTEGQEEIAKQHHLDEEFYNNRPDVIETNDSKRIRLYRSMEYLIRWFSMKDTDTKTPHVIAVSHFEIITNIIHDVFDIESFDGYNNPAFGEYLEIQAFTTEDKDKTRLSVKFKDRQKDVVFDRKNRQII